MQIRQRFVPTTRVPATVEPIASVDLNGLATLARTPWSAVIPNATIGDFLGQFYMTLTTSVVDGSIGVQLEFALDLSGTGTFVEVSDPYLGVFQYVPGPAGTAINLATSAFMLRPCDFKVRAYNVDAAALGASGNSITLTFFNPAAVLVG